VILKISDNQTKSNPMTNTTVSAAGGAMPSGSLSLNNLIDETTGQTNRAVLRGLVHRRAMADYGELSPRATRSSQRYYGPLLAQMLAGWRQRNGKPVRGVTVTAYGKQQDGVRRSAF
jgi:hypothetical protein